MVWKGFCSLNVIITLSLIFLDLTPMVENGSGHRLAEEIFLDESDGIQEQYLVKSTDDKFKDRESRKENEIVDEKERITVESAIVEIDHYDPKPSPKDSNRGYESDSNTGKQRSGSDWTLMVYLDGNHDLCTHGSSDMSEINASFAANVDVIVLKDDDSGEGNDTRMYYVNNGISSELYPDWLDDEENMGDGDNLFDFVNWSLSNYPSDRTMLLFWDHGSAYWGCCRDEDPGPDFIEDKDYLRIMEIRDALDRAIPSGEKLDVMAFCACSMANTEVCYCLADYADYLLASEQAGWLTESEGFNWDFTQIINEMNTNGDPVDICQYIIDTTMVNSENVQAHRSHTWSLIDLGEMDDLEDRLDWFAFELIDAFPDYYYEISEARLNTEEYKSGVRPDLYHFAMNIENNGIFPSELRNAANSLMTGINNAVLYEEHRTGDDVVTTGLYDPEVTGRSSFTATEDKDKTHGPVDNAHGLNIYFPVNHTGQRLSRYRSSTHVEYFTDRSQWDEWLEIYTGFIYVDDSNSGFQGGCIKYPFETIGQALDVADEYNTIRVFEGTYQENCVIELALNLTGNGTSTSPDTHINPTSGISINVSAENVVLSLLDIRSISGNGQDNILVNDNYCIINNCTIGETGGYGIHLKNTYACVIDNCTITDSQEAGLYLEDTYKTIVRKCQFFQNEIGLHLHDCYDDTIANCSIHDNSDDGVYIKDSGKIVINDCDIYNCGDYGVYADSNSYDVDGRFNYWGHASGPGGWGPGSGSEIYHAVEYSPWLGNWVGTEPNQEYYVDYHGTIQSAIDHSTPFDIIYVYHSYYKEQIIVDKTLSLYGLVESPPYPVIYHNEGGDVVNILAENVVMRYFNITTVGYSGNGIVVGGPNSEADGTSISFCNVTDVGDNGIHVDYTSNSCSFENCGIRKIGKNGILVDDSIDLAAHDINISSGRITDCVEAGIRIENRCENIFIDDCQIQNNSGNGLLVKGKRTQITGSSVINNSKSGVLLEGAEDTCMKWGKISDNTGYGLEETGASSGTDARFNFWGNESGPGGSGPGTGNGVTSNVLYSPWLGLVPDSSPMTFFVDPTGSIQTAIDNSTDDDSIQLIEGHFLESILIDKRLHLSGIGSGKDPSLNSLIDADNTGTAVTVISSSVRISDLYIATGPLGSDGISIIADNVSIDNCTLSKCGGNGISLLRSSYCNITDCLIEKADGNGIDLRYIFFYTFAGSNNNNIRNCTITQCGSSGIEIGLHCTENTITDTRVFNNSVNGIHLNGSNNCSIINCGIEKNQYGILGRDSVNTYVSRTMIRGNSRGVDVDGSSGWKITCCDIAKNTNYGVFASFSNPDVDARFNHWGNPSGPGGVGPGTGDHVSVNVLYSPWLGNKCGSVPQTFHVDKTGLIRDAVFMANDDDTIIVMKGEYEEYLKIEKKVKLIGAGPGETIINGLGTGDLMIIMAEGVHVEGLHFRPNQSKVMKTGIVILANNVTLNNVLCTSFTTGVLVRDSSGCLLKGVICTENEHGILLLSSHDNILVNISAISNIHEGLELRGSNNNNIEGGIIKFNAVGILCSNNSRGNSAHYNHLIGNRLFGVKVEGEKDPRVINATRNWWGHRNGPFNSRKNPGAKGNNITDEIPFSPWLDEEGKEIYSADTSDGDDDSEGIFRERIFWVITVLGLLLLVSFLLAVIFRYRSTMDYYED